MTPPVLIAFAVSFAAGPLLYLLMTAADVSPALLIALGRATLAVALFGAILAQNAPILGLACLWLSWVGAVAFVAHTLRRVLGTPLRSPAIRAGGALATTIPWFGLATAQMMTQ